MPRTVNEAQRTEALRLYHEEGLTAAQAALRAGVSKRTLCRWLDGTARPRGPQPQGGFPETFWRTASAEAGAAAEVTAVCPEHEPGGRVLATRVSRDEARKACGGHYRASGHSRPWVMDADRWDALLEMARGAR